MRWELVLWRSAIVVREQSTEETSIDHCTGENSGRGSRIYRRHRRPSLCARQGPRTDWSSFLSVLPQNVANSSDHTEDLVNVDYCFEVTEALCERTCWVWLSILLLTRAWSCKQLLWQCSFRRSFTYGIFARVWWKTAFSCYLFSCMHVLSPLYKETYFQSVKMSECLRWSGLIELCESFCF